MIASGAIAKWAVGKPEVVATGGSTTTIAPSVGHLSVSGYMPTVQQSAGVVIAPSVGHGIYAGHQPSIEQPLVVSPSVAHLVFSGYQPVVSITAGQIVSPGAGHAVLNGNQPAVIRTDHHSVSPGSGHGYFAGYYPSVAITSPSTMTEASIAAAVIAALNATTIPVNIKQVNSITIKGAGVTGNTWGPV